jgi:DNA-binding MurR/RpiR family transcriptional regulator
MTWLIKADGTGDVHPEGDAKRAIERADELRARGHKNIRITDVNNNPIDETALRKALQTIGAAPQPWRSDT